jgi:hypothetical protein
MVCHTHVNSSHQQDTYVSAIFISGLFLFAEMYIETLNCKTIISWLLWNATLWQLRHLRFQPLVAGICSDTTWVSHVIQQSSPDGVISKGLCSQVTAMESKSRVGNYMSDWKWHVLLPSLIPNYEWQILLHAINVWPGAPGFTSLPKEVMLEIFIAIKNQWTLAEFESMNLGSKGKYAATRPMRQKNIKQ